MIETTLSDQLVLFEVRNRVALLTLNRPNRLNAWNPELAASYAAALGRAEMDRDVRAIVVTGAGRGFCAGADIDMLSGMRGAGDEVAIHPTVALQSPKPVIGAINGACAGAGLLIALSADVRFAAAGAKFTSAFARRGLIAEHGSSWLLTRLVGVGQAMDILLSARVFLAEEALNMGLVNRVYQPNELIAASMAYAQDLADNCSPEAMRTIKAQMRADLNRPYEAALQDSLALMLRTLDTDDFREGVASFTQRRPPRFAALKGPERPA